MKVHPIIPKKRNITLQFQYDAASKKLRRLPHIFAKVLELPFHSDADVSIEETSDFLKFTVSDTDVAAGDVVADTVEIHPGVTKLVVRPSAFAAADAEKTEFELDLWRFRLPDSTRLEDATVGNQDGGLVVVVPKGSDVVDDDDDVGFSSNSHFVLVN